MRLCCKVSEKALDMNIQNLTVFGDSEIVVRQVRDSIHCLSPHLKSYQSEVWILLASEVTPGLLAGAEPDTHQFNVTIC
jgi:hypothetical protein